MGCGAAKAVQTEDINSANGKVVTDKIKPVTNGTNGTAVRRLSKAETRPMTPGAFRKLLMPKDLPPARSGVLSRARQTLIYSSVWLPKPVAFDIPLDENGKSESTSSGAENLNRKPLPKRLLSLAEQPPQQLTADELREKQMRAEEKRLQKLEEKKLKAHKYNEKFNNNCNINNNHKSENNSINNIKNIESEKVTENYTITNNNKENKSS